MFTQRATSLGVLFGGALGTAVTVFVAFQSQLNGLSNSWFGTSFSTTAVISFLWPTTFGLTITVAFGYLASLLTTTADRERGQEWVWTSIMRTPSL
jgi:Na+(H+)/acetate symporter ActP